jgi:tyrosine-specific transport protein
VKIVRVSNLNVGSIFLVSGTAIGAGMLALPAATSTIGFYPSCAVFLVIWYVMYLAALLMLEANLMLQPGSNIVSMAGHALGLFGKVFAWTIYLLLLYALNIAYLSAISDLMLSFSDFIFQIQPYRWMIVIILIAIVTSIVCLGTKTIDKINRVFMFGMMASFILLTAIFMPNIKGDHLVTGSIASVYSAIPIIATSFGFHIIIPSIRSYLHSDVVAIKKVLFAGSFIPVVIYIIWQIVILGVVPATGANSLHQILDSGNPINLSYALSQIVHSKALLNIINIFSLCIIATSFIGVSMSLFDFVADGLGVSKNRLGKTIIAIVSFLPPMLIVISRADYFFVVLGYAGVLVALLLCLLPASMVLFGRNKELVATTRLTNNFEIAIVIVFAILVILSELLLL